jgi:hypothetical protein
LFLETFYRDLGKDVYRVHAYLKKDENWADTALIDANARTQMTAAIVGGLLTLSDERRGGGWNRLPEFVRQAASDPFKANVLPDRSWVQRSGRDADEFAAFLAHGDAGDHGGGVFSNVSRSPPLNRSKPTSSSA